MIPKCQLSLKEFKCQTGKLIHRRIKYVKPTHLQSTFVQNGLNTSNSYVSSDAPSFAYTSNECHQGLAVQSFHTTTATKNEEKKGSGKASLVMQWSTQRGIGRGLNNTGVICYLNSVLQCLAYTSPLANVLLEESESSHECPLTSKSLFCAYCEIQKHVRLIFDKPGHGGLNGSYTPIGLATNLRAIGKHLRAHSNEDAHEYLRELLSKVDESSIKHKNIFRAYGNYYPQPEPQVLPGEVAPPKPKPVSIVFAIFGGYLCSQVTCSKCSFVSITFDPCMDLTLDIAHFSSLERALQAFCAPEKLEPQNMYKCRQCKKQVTATKRLTIYHPPNVLTIQFRRFDPFGRKICKLVSYSDRLDLSPYLNEKTEKSNSIYQLYGVLLHHGASTQTGHYTCYVKTSNGIWIKADDSIIVKSSLNQVLNDRDAYLLFYINQKANDPGVISYSEGDKKIAESAVAIDECKEIQCGDCGVNSTNHFASIGELRPILSQIENTPDAIGSKKQVGSGKDTSVSPAPEKHKMPNSPDFVKKASVSCADQRSSKVKLSRHSKRTMLYRQLRSHSVDERRNTENSDMLTRLRSDVLYRGEQVLTWDDPGDGDTPSEGPLADASNISIDREARSGGRLAHITNELISILGMNKKRSLVSNRLDAYDEEYDRGKVKKTKKISGDKQPSEVLVNRFQKAYEHMVNRRSSSSDVGTFSEKRLRDYRIKNTQKTKKSQK